MTRFDDITTLMYAASENAPASRVDLSQVLRDGHRRRRRRALTPAVTAALVIAIVAGVVAAVTSGPPRPRPAPAATMQFPLDRQLFALGESLGLPLTDVELTPAQQYLSYGSGGIIVEVKAPGSDEPPKGGRAAPSVFGRPAIYVYPRTGGAVPAGVAFQWAPGAWALLVHTPEPGEPDLVTIAESLRTDINEPLRFPFTVNPPPELRVALVARGGPFGGPASIGFRVDSSPASRPDDLTTDVMVVVSSWSQSPPEYAAGALPVQNATVGGRPARTYPGSSSYSVTLLDDHEFMVTVETSDTSRFSIDEVNALALSIRTLGSWDDTAQWTEHPIQP